jgi:hypothetical protein
MGWKGSYRTFILDFSDDPHEFRKLNEPPGTIYDSHDYPHISVAYDSMPDWMERTGQDISDRHGRPYQSGQGDHQQKAEYAALFRSMRLHYLRRADNYIDDVEDQLDEIVKWATGRILLREIEGAAREKHVSVKIVPYRGDDLNAFASPHIADIVAATALGRPTYSSYHNAAFRGQVGSGKGANSRVEYSPWIFTEPFEEGFRPDEALFHELVHASREMRGKFDPTPVNVGYSDEEEYLAIVLANIYMSDKHQTTFRASHGDWPKGVVPTGANVVLARADVSKFLTGNVQHANMKPDTLLENFRNSQRSFFDALAALPPTHPLFNPVRQYRDTRWFFDAAIGP